MKRSRVSKREDSGWNFIHQTVKSVLIYAQLLQAERTSVQLALTRPQETRLIFLRPGRRLRPLLQRCSQSLKVNPYHTTAGNWLINRLVPATPPVQARRYPFFFFTSYQTPLKDFQQQEAVSLPFSFYPFPPSTLCALVHACVFSMVCVGGRIYID